MAQAVYNKSPVNLFQGYSTNVELSSRAHATMNATSAKLSQVEYNDMSHGRNGSKKQLSRLELLRDDFNKKLQIEREEKINKLRQIQQENSMKQNRSGGTVREFFEERRALEATRIGKKNPELLPPIQSHFDSVRKQKRNMSTQGHFRNEQPSASKRISLKDQSQIPQQSLLRKPSTTTRTHPKQYGVSIYKRTKGIDRQNPLPPVYKTDSGVIKRKPATPNKRYETHSVLLQNDAEEVESLDSSIPIPPIQQKPITKQLQGPVQAQRVNNDSDDSQSIITDHSDLPPKLSKLKEKVLRQRTLSKQKLNIVNHQQDENVKLTDFQRWQMEQDLERKQRLHKVKEKIEKSSSEVSLSQREKDLLLKIQEEQLRLENLTQQRKELEEQERRQQKEDEKWLAHKESLEKSLLPPKPLEPTSAVPKRVTEANPRSPLTEQIPLTQTQADHNDSALDNAKSNFYAEQTEGMGEVAVDVTPCSICGRKFASDRLVKHEKVCAKASTSKRKVYDTRKHRSMGTDHEQYVANGKYLEEPKKRPKADWRAQHENFIKAIRYAKGLSDEPPPPAENPEYIQCPHCERRFKPATAERHIPKCKDIIAKPSRLKKKR